MLTVGTDCWSWLLKLIIGLTGGADWWHLHKVDNPLTVAAGVLIGAFMLLALAMIFNYARKDPARFKKIIACMVWINKVVTRKYLLPCLPMVPCCSSLHEHA